MSEVPLYCSAVNGGFRAAAQDRHSLQVPGELLLGRDDVGRGVGRIGQHWRRVEDLLVVRGSPGVLHFEARERPKPDLVPRADEDGVGREALQAPHHHVPRVRPASLHPSDALVPRHLVRSDRGSAKRLRLVPEESGVLAPVLGRRDIEDYEHPTRLRRGAQHVAHLGLGALLPPTVPVLLPLRGEDLLLGNSLLREVVLRHVCYLDERRDGVLRSVIGEVFEHLVHVGLSADGHSALPRAFVARDQPASQASRRGRERRRVRPACVGVRARRARVDCSQLCKRQHNQQHPSLPAGPTVPAGALLHRR
mmetsp:Transcript_42993/g.97800  ORF Transcript_42993/g.97800 Transcript_42993/m.97800 type:complete len:308 (+) Transcript_42993:50-973(+)